MKTFLSRPSTDSHSPPRYTPQQEVELARLDSTSTAPPPYGDEEDQANAPPTAGTFHPTVHFQIQTTGKPWLSLPLPQKPEPIPIYALQPTDTALTTAGQTPQLTSIRPERSSGSCYLTTTTTDPTVGDTTASTTTYRFGPNRPPIVRLFSPHSAPLTPAARNHLLFAKDKDATTTTSPENDGGSGGGEDHGAWDVFTVDSLGLLTRAVGFRTRRLGTFRWRYAGRKERHAFAAAAAAAAAGEGGLGGLHEAGVGEVASLLVLERVVRVATDLSGSSSSASGSKGKGGKGSGEEEVCTVVAQFVRGEGCRTPGSGASAAGNGGRLVMDLGVWEAGDVKVEREMAVLMVVTTCLVMLKREVDRRRAQQIAIMAGAAGGGS